MYTYMHTHIICIHKQMYIYIYTHIRVDRQTDEWTAPSIGPQLKLNKQII